MPNGSCSKTPCVQRHLDVSHIPVGSEEIITSEKAVVTIQKGSAKEIWLTICVAGVYDGDYFDAVGLTEQALMACLPQGCWRTGGVLSGD